MISYKYSQEEKQQLPREKRVVFRYVSLICCARVVGSQRTRFTHLAVCLCYRSAPNTHTHTHTLTLFIQTLVPPADVPNITAHVEPKGTVGNHGFEIDGKSLLPVVYGDFVPIMMAVNGTFSCKRASGTFGK